MGVIVANGVKIGEECGVHVHGPRCRVAPFQGQGHDGALTSSQRTYQRCQRKLARVRFQRDGLKSMPKKS